MSRIEALISGIRAMVILGVLTVTIGVAAQNTDGNLIKNGNFSEALRYWVRQGKGEADITVKDGKLFFKKKTNDYVVLRQDVKIPSFGAYSLNISADNRNMPGSSITVIPFINGKWGNYRVIKYLNLKPVDGGQQVSRMLSFGSGVSKVRIAISGNTTGTSFYSISLKKTFARETQKIPALSTVPKLDGNLDDKFWKDALKLSGFRVLSEPTSVAKDDTEVFIASNGDYLYVAYNVNEPYMDKMSIVQKNTVALYGGDQVDLFVSPNHTQYIQFLANADGFKGASQKIAVSQKLNTTWYEEPKTKRRDFTGKWQVAAKKFPNKYTIEMAIDLKDLFDNKTVTDPSIFLNFCRHRTTSDISQEYTNWAGLAGNTFHAPSDFPEFKLSWKHSGNISPKNKNAPGTPHLSRITEPLDMPAMFIVGKPVKMTKKPGSFELPASLEFNDKVFPVDNGVKKYISLGLVNLKSTGIANIEIAKWNEALLPSLTKADKLRCSSPEAFMLTVEPKTIKINARTREGALRALATLALLGSRAKCSKSLSLPCFVMVDAPWFKVRGWDAGGIRSPKQLKRLVDLYFLLRMNHLEFEVTTYGKYATFPFDSYPNISSSKYTKKEYRELADYARARGITLVPLFYSWSRSGFIFNKPEYSSLAATQIKEPYKKLKTPYNRNGNAFDPKTAAMIFKLCDELIDTMKLTKLNLGLDEVHFGKMVDQNAPYSKGKTDLDWFKTVITKSQKHLARRGVTMWMFSDELNPNHSGPKNGIINAREGINQLASLPKDVVMLPWHYQIPQSGSYDAVPFFKRAGFPVVGAPCWYRKKNVPTFINELRYYNADGILGTTWGNALPDTEDTVAELLNAVSLLAYLAWSPENCDVSELPFIPATLYQHIAFRYGKEAPYANKSNNLILATNGSPIKAIKKEIGFPEYMQPDFLKKSFRTWRGVKMVPFLKNGDPVAAVLHGNAKENITIPVNQKFERLSLLHAVNKIYNYQLRDIHKYKKITPAIYELTYEDGTKATLPLTLRKNINEWNDVMLAKECEPGIFGSMEHQLQVNIPIYTWVNPFPAKKVKSLTIRSGNDKSMNLYLFGASLD